MKNINKYIRNRKFFFKNLKRAKREYNKSIYETTGLYKSVEKEIEENEKVINKNAISIEKGFKKGSCHAPKEWRKFIQKKYRSQVNQKIHQEKFDDILIEPKDVDYDYF